MLDHHVVFASPNAADGFGGSGHQMSQLCSFLRRQGMSSDIVLRKSMTDDYVNHRYSHTLSSVRHLPTPIIVPMTSEDRDLSEILSAKDSTVLYIHIDLFFRLWKTFPISNLSIIIYVGISQSYNFRKIQDANVISMIRAIVCISEMSDANIRHSISLDSRMVSIPVYLVRPGTYIYSDESERQYIEATIPKQKKVIVSVGSTRSYKQIDHFIRLVADLRSQYNSQLLGIFVGPIKREWLGVTAADFSIDYSTSNNAIRVEDVWFVGPSTYVLDWIERSTLCVCTSTSYENIPGFLRESMLGHCPVISYNVGAVGELISDGWNGRTVVPGDYSQLLRTAQIALEQEEETRVMAIRAHRFVRAFFSERIHQQSNLRIIQNFVDR